VSEAHPQDEPDLSPEAVLERATAARGDIFPEWRSLVYASPKTYHLINQTVSYLHQYHGEQAASAQLSVRMRELIAIPALCAKGDLRHAPNHIRRIYREGLTNKALFEAASAYASVAGWSSLTRVSLAIEQANSADYSFGKLPRDGQPKALRPFPEMTLGRQRAGTAGERSADSEEWRFAASIDPELTRRAAAFVDRCVAADGAMDTVLGPGLRELIVRCAHMEKPILPHAISAAPLTMA